MPSCASCSICSGTPEWWWSMLVLALAGITCVMGVLYALMQHDLKRLLAYHTVENIGIIFIGLGLALGFQIYRARLGRRARLHRGAAARAQPFAVQEPPVPGLGRRARRDRRARHGASRRPDPQHAAHRLHLPGRLHRHLGAAAAERLRLRMADLPSHPAKPAASLLGLEVPDPRRRRAACALRRARRRLLRQGVRHHLSRPPAHRSRQARA